MESWSGLKAKPEVVNELNIVLMTQQSRCVAYTQRTILNTSPSPVPTDGLLDGNSYTQGDEWKTELMCPHPCICSRLVSLKLSSCLFVCFVLFCFHPPVLDTPLAAREPRLSLTAEMEKSDKGFALNTNQLSRANPGCELETALRA
jgi:hypothetical protein